MQDTTEILGHFLKKLLLRNHPQAWAAECEQTLWVLGNCIGDKDARQIAEFFGCQESDVVKMLATISLCREQSEWANTL